MTIIRLIGILILLPLFGYSQSSKMLKDETPYKELLQAYLNKNKDEWKLTEKDVRNWSLSHLYTNDRTGITYLYLHQEVNGVRIFNSVSSVSIKDNEVRSFAKRFHSNANAKINTSVPVVTPSTAIAKAAEELGVTMTEEPVFLSSEKSINRNYFSPSGISSDKIRVDLVFQPVGQTLRLAWDVNIHFHDNSHWWNVRIDAVNGQFLQKNDWVVHCDFDGSTQLTVSSTMTQPANSTANQNNANSIPSYRVFPLPLESPGFGPSVLLADPADPTASPYGWHDTNGSPGAEFTITRGNNVFAYDDIAAQDQPGFSPDGSASLLFDFPINFSQAPASYLSASITNLFYVNNRMHDILFLNGFDEQSGNFQATNYSGQGLGQDYILAEGQDGGGTNNANFGTPDDGQNPTMQMFLWTSPVPSTFTVNSPAPIAGTYSSVAAGFGPGVTSPITANLVIIDDGTGTVSDACEPIVNGAALSGKIVLIERGTCNFVDKVLAAQNEGALAVLMINNVAGAIFAMGDNGNGGSVTIPSQMISSADGATLKNSINSGATVNVTLTPPPTTAVDLDGDLDNGIVVHEFGHGVSNRLTGGPSNSSCLFNGEQGGEGWSDFFALMLTTRPGDVGTTARGIGTYALGQTPNGSGIRRYPYSTDMNINPETYGFLAQSPETHDVGEVWCSVLWDLNWALINQYSFDADWSNANAGNVITLKLVLEGMKLQPCGPGFLDSRDAILAADDILYNGIHKCLIWEIFARRGMGFDALQGDPDVAGDETEGFSLPAICLTPTSAPVADFNASPTRTCYGLVRFNDLSTDIPQAWYWNFGDGNVSTLQNPSHTYSASGTYTVTLKVTNTLGADSLIRTSYITINIPPVPVVTGDTIVCAGDSTVLTAQVNSGFSAVWKDANNNILFEGNVYNTPAINTTTSYYVTQQTNSPLLNVGPANNTFGTGGYHNTSFEGRIKFSTLSPLRLKSVWVDASGSGTRTVNLYGQTGTLIQSLTLNIPNGQSRVSLLFDIPLPGNYEIGVSAGSNLYRNNAGANYPYTINGLVSITGSNSTTNPNTFYYYLYDWEVQELPCLSPVATVVVNNGAAVTSSFNFISTGLTTQFTSTSAGNPVSYSWDFGNGNSSNLPNPVFTFPSNGTFSVSLTVTDADGCVDISIQQVSVNTNGISEINAQSVSINYYNRDLVIKFQSKVDYASIRVFDPIGKLLFSDNVKNSFEYQKKLKDISTESIFINVETKNSSHSKIIPILNQQH